MSRLFYFLVIKPLSLLPLSILFYLSDLTFFLFYYVAGYRKSVVRKNLENSFPDKSDKEIAAIQKKFFRHLCDLIFEDIKLFSISRKEMLSRFIVRNPEILDWFYQQGQSIVMVASHYNNWEFGAKALATYIPHHSITIYSPLKNKFFNKKIDKSRSELGMEMLPKGLVPRSFVANRNKLTNTIFAADQSPTYSKVVHWTTFLNQDTALPMGVETFAVKYNYPVTYIQVNKVKRGYYECDLKVLHENPANTERGEVSELHARSLEQAIIEKPEYWLWSHKRWKRKKPLESMYLDKVEGHGTPVLN